MDENFIVELVAEGEKKFSFEIPLSMSFGDAINNLIGTVNEVIGASENWKDQDGLKSVIALEANGWREIFKKALQVADDLSSVGDGDNADKLIGLANSGNKVMKHLHVSGERGSDALKMYFVFSVVAGPKFVTSLDFG